MGKSPGKWIKTLIFGKKKKKNNSSRSKYSTPNDEARQSFKTLKGIIRLQALIRGHLVRRQAISTLYCMFQIVKFQALVRGIKIRNSIVGVQVGKRCTLKVMYSAEVNTSIQILKLSSNHFAQKILASSPTPMPLHFHYESKEPNSVASWLKRWSASQCWKLPQKPKSNNRSKPLKPDTRRSSVTNMEIVASEFDKPIRNLRKFSSDEAVSYIEENPELVLERIKRNLRKVSSSILQNTNDSVQNIITAPELEKLRVTEAETMIVNKNTEEDVNVKEKTKSRRVASVPVKQEFIENKEPSPIKIKRVPGYMAATVSAKAKLRGLNGPEVENSDTLTRRYSLPSNLTNASVPVSPMAKTTGRLKTDRSLQLSRDGIGNVKLNQVEWRR